MKQFTCLNCGKTSSCVRSTKQFCSKRWYRQYCQINSVKPIDAMRLCLHNAGAECNGGDCSTCGWNPDVAAARKAELVGGQNE